MGPDEMVEEIRAMIADRNTSERQRAALVMLLRMAARGRHISSTRLPAMGAGIQAFAKANEILKSSHAAASTEIQRGLDAMSASGPEPDDES